MGEYYCPHCEADLEEQWGFDSSVGHWTCTECGHTNIISEDEIRGVRFIEKSIGKTLVKRYLMHCREWWMTLDGEVLRPTERSLNEKGNENRNWDLDRELIANMQKVNGKYLNQYAR